MATTTTIHRSTEGWQKRTRLDFDNLLTTADAISAVTGKPSAMEIVHGYWRSRARNGVVRVEDFNPHRDLGELGVTISHVDVGADNPWHYRFTSFKGVYFRWMSGRCLADYPVKGVVDECAVEYFECKSAGGPMAHHIQHNLGGFSRDYLRLLLPLAGTDGRPAALVSVGLHLALLGRGGSSKATPPGSTKP
jgi:hypothetical protein